MAVVTIPEWFWKMVTGILSAIVIGTMSWAWSAESRINRVEDDTARCAAKLDTVQTNESAIRVLETRLQYIESGIDDIKELLKER